MERKDLEKDVGAGELSCYMMKVIEGLKSDRKYPAVHTYTSTLHSFADFSGGREVALPMREVFTPGRLKEYENWLLVQCKLSLNTVSTYMRTLQAVYNRWMPLGCAGHNPKLFDDVYTRVESHTKRALTEQQMQRLMYAETASLSGEQKKILAYFVLMFLFRGMPFIDLAHLRKNDVKGNTIIYRRHKTGKQMTVHIPKEAVLLIHEFREKNPQSIYLFPILDARLCEGQELYKCYQDALRRFNKSLGGLMRLLLPGVRVSSYTARHTWATLAFYMGMPVGIICQSLGHSSVRVTETYLKPFENERIDKANRKLISSVRKCKWRNNVAHNTL
ncbi:tyrosine-type recombinase/integrase [uncultured Bacteroides sp.]|jgi:hypothetical protein|uniref:tyrosine-type recombinase/integrase n=1 Tax=uncultured Bacteroides sp. TaxID=162156 RepID=UPI00280A7294|nr:tyrosine-type recombinase/integrase [uncultured Bacteroides sp.]